MKSVLDAARPLVDMIWIRETEQGGFETPERRAAFEARIREIARSVGDETVRRHYEQALSERLRSLFAPAAATRGPAGRPRVAGRGRQSDPDAPHYVPTIRTRPVQVSQRLQQTLIRSVPGPRETVLIMTMVNHPALLADHFAAFAEVELANRELDSLRSQILEIAADEPHVDAETLRNRLAGAGAGELLDRLGVQIRRSGIWQAGAGASDEDALDGWIQALTLHRKARTLHKELKDAEAALASDPSDANLAHLVDIQNQLANSEGTEALIEGFGASSGRGLKSV